MRTSWSTRTGSTDWFGCLADASVYASTPEDPYAPANHHADAMLDSGSFRGLLPAVGLNQLEVVAEGQHEHLVVDEDGTPREFRPPTET